MEPETAQQTAQFALEGIRLLVAGVLFMLVIVICIRGLANSKR